MWSIGEKIGKDSRKGSILISESRYTVGRYRKKEKKKLSASMALFLGAIAALEIMTAGAMLFHIDVKGTDIIALIFTFVVLYAGIIAVLTDE